MPVSAYSDLKVLHHRDRLDQLSAGVVPAPVHVHLVISDLCNHDCGFCSYRASGMPAAELFPIAGNHNPPRMLRTDKAREILNDAAEMGVKAIMFTGGGEPSVHPDFRELLACARVNGLKVGVTTNGARLSESVLDELGRADWVRFSLDAGTADMYRRIHRVGADVYARVLSNIAKLHDDPRRRCRLSVNYVVTNVNYVEVYAAAQVVSGIADAFRCGAVVQPDGGLYWGEQEIADASDNCRRAEQLESETFAVQNDFDSRARDTCRPDYTFCGTQFLTPYIGADQNVYRCCETAYSTNGLLGSLRGKRFKEVWESPETAVKMLAFDARSCAQCRFNNKNRVINYAVSPSPPDVDFV